MSGMNPWLASIYGTDGADDLEKTAQTHLLQKLAEEQNIDLSQFSEEELQALLQEVMGQQVMQQAGGAPQQFAGPQGAAPQQPQGVHPSMNAFSQQQPQAPQGFNPAMQQGGGQDMAAMQKEAQAKFDEADLLGRVMAHAYTQELEKIAGSKADAVKGAVNSARNRVGHAAERAGAKIRSKATEVGMKARHHKGAIGAAAATGAVGFGAGRMSKSKEASAFEKLAEMHAADILGAAGIDPASGQDQWAAQQGIDQNPTQVNDQQGQEQQVEGGSNDEQFAQALDTRALEMLQQAGYNTDELVQRIQWAQQQAQQGNQGQS